MAIALVAEVPGLTREQYESVVRKVNEAGAPAGALFHGGGPIEGGYKLSTFPNSWEDAKVLRVEIDKLWKRLTT